jgi:hypothetical protein
MSNVLKLFQSLWKTILLSNLHAKDKAEVLRLLIFGFVTIVQSIIFVLLIEYILDRF